MRFFRYYQKSLIRTFQIFRMTLKRHKKLKLTQMIFWKKISSGVFWGIVVQNKF